MSDEIPDRILIEGWMVLALRNGRWKRCTSNAAGIAQLVFESEEAADPARIAALQTGATDVRVIRVSGKIDVIEPVQP